MGVLVTVKATFLESPSSVARVTVHETPFWPLYVRNKVPARSVRVDKDVWLYDCSGICGEFCLSRNLCVHRDLFKFGLLQLTVMCIWCAAPGALSLTYPQLTRSIATGRLKKITPIATGIVMESWQRVLFECTLHRTKSGTDQPTHRPGTMTTGNAMDRD